MRFPKLDTLLEECVKASLLGYTQILSTLKFSKQLFLNVYYIKANVV